MDPSSSQPPPSASITEGSKQKRPRLKGRGVQVLEEFVKIHGLDVEPDKQQRKQLLADIRSYPEYHDYPMANIKKWFMRRQKDASTHASTSYFPSLSASKQNDLKSLLLGTTLPPKQEVMETWAKLLKVPVWEIIGFIEIQPPAGSKQWHPPTPRNTTSPEPDSPMDDIHDILDKTDLLSSPMIPLASNLENPFVPKSATFQDALWSEMLSAISQADKPAPPLTASDFPNNPEQFNMMFQPYLDKIQRLESFLDAYLPA